MTLRNLIIRWNNDNPLDKQFREKYNIAFNSPRHREVNQIDVLTEYIESQVFEEFEQNVKERQNKEKLYNQGNWISEVQLSSEESEDLFSNLDISLINQNSQLQIEE